MIPEFIIEDSDSESDKEMYYTEHTYQPVTDQSKPPLLSFKEDSHCEELDSLDERDSSRSQLQLLKDGDISSRRSGSESEPPDSEDDEHTHGGASPQLQMHAEVSSTHSADDQDGPDDHSEASSQVLSIVGPGA